MMKLTSNLFVTEANPPFSMNADSQTLAVPVAERMPFFTGAPLNPSRHFGPLRRCQAGLAARPASDAQQPRHPFPVEPVNKCRYNLAATTDSFGYFLHRNTGSHPLNGLKTISQSPVGFRFQLRFQKLYRDTAFQLNRFGHGSPF